MKINLKIYIFRTQYELMNNQHIMFFQFILKQITIQFKITKYKPLLSTHYKFFLDNIKLIF